MKDEGVDNKRNDYTNTLFQMSGFCPKIRILVVNCCLCWDKSTDFGQENSTYFILFKMKKNSDFGGKIQIRLKVKFC